MAVVGGLHPSESLVLGVPPWLAPIMVLLPLVPWAWFLVTLAGGLRGLHAVSARRAAGALLIALAASGLLLGVLHTVIQFTLGVPHFVVLCRAIPFDILY